MLFVNTETIHTQQESHDGFWHSWFQNDRSTGFPLRLENLEKLEGIFQVGES